MTIGAVRATGHPIFYDLGFAAFGGSLITAFLLILLRQRMTGTQPERFGAASKAHFVSGGGTGARFLAWLAVCGTRAVMPYGIPMLALVNLTPLVIVLAALGANVYWIALGTRLRTLLAVPVRMALVLAIAVTASACGGTDSAPSTTATPPSAPYSATDLREGTGATATQGRTVMVSYTGWLYDPTKPESKGSQFDSQTSFSFQLGVGRVIAGWDQGVAGMKEGGQRVLVIPASLAYGAQAVGPIPANSTLIFVIQLDKVQKAQ